MKQADVKSIFCLTTYQNLFTFCNS